MKKILKIFTALLLILALAVIPMTACAPKKEYTYVSMTIKDYGGVIIALDREAAPLTVDNFLSHVEAGFYDGLTFHRSIRGSMLQGGDPFGNGSGGSGLTVKGEFSKNGVDNPLKHTRGTITLARGEGYDSASCQFIICMKELASFDGEYAAFGHVVSGLDTLDRVNVDMAKHSDDQGNVSIKEYQAVIEKIVILDNYG